MVRSGCFDLRVRSGLDGLADADTVIVPGIGNITAPVPAAVIAALQAVAGRGVRIASICSGTFVFAASGLLAPPTGSPRGNSQRGIQVHADASVLFVDNGQILTSTGAAAGLDLCLHLVRRDLAADAARLAVMPLEREGGQAQFIIRVPP